MIEEPHEQLAPRRAVVEPLDGTGFMVNSRMHAPLVLFGERLASTFRAQQKEGKAIALRFAIDEAAPATVLDPLGRRVHGPGRAGLESARGFRRGGPIHSEPGSSKDQGSLLQRG
jgi:hypothetical protein